MQQFREEYLAKCADLSIQPLATVMNTLEEYENSSLDEQSKTVLETLNLSSLSLSVKACAALSSALSNNSFFTKLILADAFLGDDGCED